jgi:putative transposase
MVESGLNVISRNQYPAVGIDMGLTSFATLSNGEKVPNPRFFRTEEKELANAQRRLSKLDNDSPERQNAILVVHRD